MKKELVLSALLKLSSFEVCEFPQSFHFQRKPSLFPPNWTRCSESSEPKLVGSLRSLPPQNKLANLKFLTFSIGAVLVLLFVLPIVSADILSVNSGGDREVVITSNSLINGFFFGNVSDNAVIEPPPSVGGGPSGGGSGRTPDEFNLSTTLVIVEMNQGQAKTENLLITNNLKVPLKITGMEVDPELKKLLALDEDYLTLLPNENRKISLNFFAVAGQASGTYAGRVTIKSGRTKKIVNVVIQIKENKPLFDVNINLDKTHYAPGETVMATIGASNFGELKNIDALVYYAIKGFDGSVVASKEESYAIENYQLQFVGKLETPKNIPADKYVFYVRVSYGNVTATGSQVFDVGESKSLASTFLYWVVAVAVLCISIAVIFYKRQQSRPPRPARFK